MNILGIHIGHDSSAALVIDGKIIADVCEERFSRIKHYCGLPFKAVEFCLAQGRLKIGDIDLVAVSSSKPIPELKHLFVLKKPSDEEHKGMHARFASFYQRFKKVVHGVPPLYVKPLGLSGNPEIFHVEHHLAHAASAYYTSGINKRALIVTIDGIGDGVSVAIWRGENGQIEPLLKIGSEGSIGWFYGIVTEALGWWHGDGEGKTMGLAPYGDYSKTEGLLDSFCPEYADGRLKKGHDYGITHWWNEKGCFHWHFEESRNIQNLIRKYSREIIAAEAQRVLEERVQQIVSWWLKKEKTDSLCCAGGVFLNVKLNQRIWESGEVKDHYIFPNAGDGGLALGAALYAYHARVHSRKVLNIGEVYWGPSFTNEEIEAVLKLRNLEYESNDNVSAVCAQCLAEGKIVAWFRGRMESGPRALGSRSILMSAGKAENKDIINSRVKFREAFRPFCPSLIADAREGYLKNSREEPFMITSFDIDDSKRHKVPAVVHVDGTVRPQTVKEEVNPAYYRLIEKFGELTGDPVILNTSFNIRGEPIICTPRDAIRCFYDSGIDLLVLGDFLLKK